MRGDVHLLRAPGDTEGREQRGQRYVVVVQGDAIPPSVGTVLGVPTSTREFHTVFQPRLEVSGRATYALCEQLRSYDRARIGRHVTRLARDELDDIDDALRLVLDLNY